MVKYISIKQLSGDYLKDSLYGPVCNFDTQMLERRSNEQPKQS